MGNEMGKQNSNGLQASEEDGAQAIMGVNDSEASIVSTASQDQQAVACYAADSIQTEEQHGIMNLVNDESSRALFISNAADDVEGMSHASPSAGSPNLPEKQSSHSNYSATNDNLNQKQTSKRREQDEMTASVLSSLSNCDSSTEGTMDPQISEAVDNLASDGNGDVLEDTKMGRQDGNATTNPNSNIENYMQHLPMIESRDKVLMEHGVVEGSNEENGVQGYPQSEIVEDDTSTGRVNSTYLDAIDAEIEKVIIEEDHKTLENAETTEMSEAIQTDDIEDDTFEIKLEVSAINEKENLRGDTGGTFEDSCLKQATETGKWNEIERKYGKQEDYSQRVAPELCKENSEGKSERAEFGNRTILMESFNPDSICQEKIAYRENLDNGSEGLDNGKTFLVSISPLDPIGNVSGRMQANLEGSDATETAAKINTKLISGKSGNWFKEVPSTTSEAHFSYSYSQQVQIPASFLQSPGEIKKSIPMDHASSITRLKALEGSVTFNTQSSQGNPCVGSDDTPVASINLEQSTVATEYSAQQAQNENCKGSLLLHQTESLKHIIYKSESGDEAQKNSGRNTLEVRIEKSMENPLIVAETNISTTESSPDESDMNPLLNQKKSGDSDPSAQEASDSGKLRSPLEEAYAVESLETQKGLIPKKTAEDVCTPPAEESMDMPLQGKGKQKPRYSLFGNCMCCTTTIN